MRKSGGDEPAPTEALHAPATRVRRFAYTSVPSGTAQLRLAAASLAKVCATVPRRRDQQPPPILPPGAAGRGAAATACRRQHLDGVITCLNSDVKHISATLPRSRQLAGAVRARPEPHRPLPTVACRAVRLAILRRARRQSALSSGNRVGPYLLACRAMEGAVKKGRCVGRLRSSPTRLQ
jgi:hypothetical protein